MSFKQRLKEAVPIHLDERVPFEIVPVITNVADAQAILNLIEATEEISKSGTVDIDERIDWIEVQADRDSWNEFLTALRAVTDE